MKDHINRHKGKVLLVVHDLYQDDVHFPLGVGYVAAALRQAGAEVSIFNQDLYHFSNDILSRILADNEYDLIGVGFLAARFCETVLPLCKVINQHKRRAKLMLGGHGASALPEYMLQTTQADVVVMGEGEITAVEVLQAAVKGRPFDGIAGIAYRDGNEIRINHKRPRQVVHDIKPPAWDLFPMDVYTSRVKGVGQDDRAKSAQLISSRGCINACTFCHRLNRGWRGRTVDDVVREMKILYERYGVTYFFFLDELFVASQERMSRFADALNAHRLLGKIKYSAGGVRANAVTIPISRLLKESGCCYVNVGFESMSQAVLDEMQKNVTVEDNVRCVQSLRRFDIPVGANFVWGMPADTAETLQANVDFLKKYNTYDEVRTIRPVTPYPGSRLYDYAVEKGLLGGPQDFFDRFRNSDLVTVNFTQMSTDQMHALLFSANTQLILDHHRNTTGDMAKAGETIEAFRKLYFENDVTFRGVRRYEKVS